MSSALLLPFFFDEKVAPAEQGQIIALPATVYTARGTWTFAANRPQVDSGFVSAPRYLASVTLSRNAPHVTVSFASAASGVDAGNADLSDDFEARGLIKIEHNGTSITINMADFADSSDPYTFTLTGDLFTAYAALYSALAAANEAGRLTLAFPTAPALVLRHSYSITVGSSGTLVGYWMGNAGSITDENYTLPNGATAEIRQTMIDTNVVSPNIEADRLRFLINAAGLGVGDTDQFPKRIDVMDTVNGVALELDVMPVDPVDIAVFGQGIGQDYQRSAGSANTLAELFISGRTLDIDLYY